MANDSTLSQGDHLDPETDLHVENPSPVGGKTAMSAPPPAEGTIEARLAKLEKAHAKLRSEYDVLKEKIRTGFYS